MKTFLNLFPLTVIFALLLAACGGAAPPSLPVADELTLVYFYTDG
jgi:hypothetical protein